VAAEFEKQIVTRNYEYVQELKKIKEERKEKEEEGTYRTRPQIKGRAEERQKEIKNRMSKEMK